ncbi:MAG: hypothetical protein Q8P35_02155 [Candidatus Yanofskybacteria bacterium]|nr:hypothetical protein [Candidatus Yanofskybacteria bacterium]
MRKNIKINSTQERALRQKLESGSDVSAGRLKRFLAMPDLSRTAGNPINELVERILALGDFKDFDVVEVPEIVPVDKSFDLFNFPEDHPARSPSDTYYVDENNILRTHTTIMWYYYLISEEAKEKIKKNLPIGVLAHGKVYRKDEIDRHHMNVFHQMDGLYIVPKEQRIIVIEDLQNVLANIAKAIYGEDIKYRFNQDTFPYTDPSIEMEIQINRGSSEPKWVEVLGSGIVHPAVLEELGVDSSIYNGWAFGFGLERLAIISMELPDIRLLWSNDERVKKQLKLGNKFKEVSKFPPITRDISFVVGKDFVPNNYFDLIRDLGGDLVEEVALIDKYEDAAKFGSDKISYTYRITYRSTERTLQTGEIDPIQEKIYQQTAAVFKAEMR